MRTYGGHPTDSSFEQDRIVYGERVAWELKKENSSVRSLRVLTIMNRAHRAQKG